MSRSAASQPGQLLSPVCGIVTLSLCTLFACSSSSSITFGDGSSSGGASDSDGGDGSEAAGSDAAALFTAPDAIRSLTGEAALDPRSLSPLDGRGVLFFDAASESIILLDRNGTPVLFTMRDELLAVTGQDAADLGRMDVAEGGPFDGQALCSDAVSGLLLRIGVDGIPHVHATGAQVLAATGGAGARIHLPRSMAPGQIIAQDLESLHILSFDPRGETHVLVDRADLALAAGVPEDAAEISGWARGPAVGDQFAWFSSTTAVVRIRLGGVVERHLDPVVLQAVFPDFTNLAIVDLAADEETGELYILVSDGGVGKGIAVASPGGARVRLFTHFDDFPETSGFADIFDLGFLTLGGDRFFYAMDGIGAAVFTLDAQGTPREVSGPRDLLEATRAPRVALGPGAPIDDVGLVVLERESSSFVLLRGSAFRGASRRREPAPSS